jgi:hypothetical protein
LEADRPEVSRRASNILFRKKDDIRPIDALQVNTASIKSIEQSEDGRKHDGLGALTEGRPKAIRAWARGGTH